MNGAVTGNSEGKGSALCVGNIILIMQKDAKGIQEGVSMIFRMQVEPGAVAVVPGPIGRMQAKGPALPNAQQLPAPLNSGVQICVNFIVMIEGLQGLECKIVCLLPLPSFSSFSSPSSSLLFFSPPPLMSAIAPLHKHQKKARRGSKTMSVDL